MYQVVIMFLLVVNFNVPQGKIHIQNHIQLIIVPTLVQCLQCAKQTVGIMPIADAILSQ